MGKRRWQFWIDVGGTFTDCISQDPAGKTRSLKVLSSGRIKGCAVSTDGCWLTDPARQDDPDGIWTGFTLRSGEKDWGTIVESSGARLRAGQALPAAPFHYELTSDMAAPLVAIRYLVGAPGSGSLPPMDVRLGTTRGTNALLTRSGSKTALVTTRGFGDLWEIGYQSRAELFQLDIVKPEQLYAGVIEVDERVDAEGKVLRALNPQAAQDALRALANDGFESLAICLLHANANPEHEREIAKRAKALGFAHISVSHEVSTLRKAVPRGDTTILDAYLTPILNDYLAQIAAHLPVDSTLELMTSSGGLSGVDQFRGKDSILSGPAGGVVGMTRVARCCGFESAIGFDMGGTSTDVARAAQEGPELEYETEKAGVRVVTPMMAIETVAAGGGSVCQFDGVKLTVGPESAGADPGPACYGRGGPLTVTDVNLFLGRILPQAFPFPLNEEAVERQLREQCEEIARQSGTHYTLENLADGYRRIANTNMAEAIRCVSVERGADPRQDVLVAFGGAAGQHACAVAAELGMRQLLIHPYAGLLSALGIGQAARTAHAEVGVYRALADCPAESWDALFAPMRAQAAASLGTSGLAGEPHFTELLELRFAGLDATLTLARPDDDDFEHAYRQQFYERHGYEPQEAPIDVVAARVIAQGAVPQTELSRRSASQRVAKPASMSRLWQDAKHHPLPVFAREALAPGDQIEGPALITENTSTTIVEAHWRAEVLTAGELLLTSAGNASDPAADTAKADPILLEVFNKRFEAIATQMGSTLRRTARSVNVKERLDYSCALFTASGDLVVNAPHIPVHLGAMGNTVRHILQYHQLEPGDVLITNDPYQGGSHLPDVTVITPVHDQHNGQLRFLTASRAHHAEIGGVTPGSMPPFSTRLEEEGVLIAPMKIVEAGIPKWDRLVTCLQSARYPSRDIPTNIADVEAQVAANAQGARRLEQFIADVGWPVVDAYMTFIQDAASEKLRQALTALPDGPRRFQDHLDDGSPIALTLTISGDTAHLDFAGTGPVLAGNLNANRAIVTAAALYSLRCLINEDIPLNQGVLEPITMHLPSCLLNPNAEGPPSGRPAVVGGNVETSQRVVDVLLGAFGLAAASQGTMNNFLFGNADFGYYETICGGAGATPRQRGASAVHTHMTNTRLTDPEVLEHRFPVRLHRFALRPNSGGIGRFPGGSGVVREVEFLVPLDVSLLTQRRGKYQPYGCEGGGKGAAGRNTLVSQGEETDLGGACQLSVAKGDVIRIETPGGGGWGRA